jgi:hypothetical protein
VASPLDSLPELPIDGWPDEAAKATDASRLALLLAPPDAHSVQFQSPLVQPSTAERLEETEKSVAVNGLPVKAKSPLTTAVISRPHRAGDGIRTHDVQLGKSSNLQQVLKYPLVTERKDRTFSQETQGVSCQFPASAQRPLLCTSLRAKTPLYGAASSSAGGATTA